MLQEHLLLPRLPTGKNYTIVEKYHSGRKKDSGLPKPTS
jgi:hypothetical protein